MNTKNWLITCVASAVIGGIVVKRYIPTEVTKTETKIQDRTTVITHEVVKPDGTRVIDSTANSSTTTIAKTEQTKATLPPNWKASAGLALYGEKYYKFELDRRILGPVFIGAFGTTANQCGVSIGFEF